MTEFHISKNGQSEGPYTKGEVLDAIQKGRFSVNDLVWKTGDTNWKPLSLEFPSLNGRPMPQQRSAISNEEETSDTFAALALMLPIAGTVLAIFWVGSMNLLQDPMSSLAMVSAFVVIGSAILITLDAGKIGIAGPNDPAVMDGKKVTPPIGWGIATALLWLIFFPAYMYWRSKVGAKNYLLIATLGMLAFMGSVFEISGAIEKKEQEVIQTLSSFGGELNSLGEIE